MRGGMNNRDRGGNRGRGGIHGASIYFDGSGRGPFQMSATMSVDVQKVKDSIWSNKNKIKDAEDDLKQWQEQVSETLPPFVLHALDAFDR